MTDITEIPVVVSASGGDHRPTIEIRSNGSVAIDCHGTAYILACDRDALADRLLEIEAAPIVAVEEWSDISPDLWLYIGTDGDVAVCSSEWNTAVIDVGDLSRVARAVRL